MSIAATRWAIQVGKDKKLPPTARHVLFSLADRANVETQDCFPSFDTIADDTGLSRSTVFRAVRILEDEGVIVRGKKKVRDGKFGRVNMYFLPVTDFFVQKYKKEEGHG